MGIRILTDSASDFSLKELENYRVGLIPMQILCGEDAYTDDKTIPMESFWQKLIDGTTVKTSQPSPSAFVEAFKAAKEAGDEVICIVISSQISGTLQTAILSREIAQYDKVYVVDSRMAAASVAEKMLVLEACRLRDQGQLGAQEIVERLEAFRSKIRLYACLDTLDYLAKGGRISKTVASVGALAKIKPIITFSENGSISVEGKPLGSARAMKAMTALMESRKINSAYPVIPLYAHDRTNAMQYVCRLAKKNIISTDTRLEPIGCTIGTYIGPGAYGIVFVEE